MRWQPTRVASQFACGSQIPRFPAVAAEAGKRLGEDELRSPCQYLRRLQRKRGSGFLEDGAGLAALARVGGIGGDLLAAEDDLLEEEDVIFPIDLGLVDDEDIVEEELTKVGEVVALPVFDATFEVLDSRVVLRPSLCLVDLISDALGRLDAGFELVDVRIVGVADGLDKRLSRSTCESVKR